MHQSCIMIGIITFIKLGTQSLKASSVMPTSSAVSSVSPTVTRASANEPSLPLKSPRSSTGLTTTSDMKRQQKSSSRAITPPSASHVSTQKRQDKSRRTSIIP